MENLSTSDYLAHCAAMGAYLKGFAAGADPRRSRRRYVYDGTTHAHWLRGYDDGRSAAYAAERAYEAEQRMQREQHATSEAL